MITASLLNQLCHLAKTPDSIKTIRAFVLQAAMSGRLSRIERGDTTLCDLEQIVNAERKARGYDKNALKAICTSDIGLTRGSIPSHWSWYKFGDIAHHNAGKMLNKGQQSTGRETEYITTSNLYWGYFKLDGLRKMPIRDDELERCTATKGDLLICEGGEAGRAAVWTHDRLIAFQNHVHRARPFGGISPYYLQLYFWKLELTGEIAKHRKGVGITSMSGKTLSEILIPLPPLAEQKRIVAKVDELMALCDRLEAQLKERDLKQAALARAALAKFTEDPTPENLQLLFHPSFSIEPEDLKKLILNLAIKGKLTEQNPADEPAHRLLERIAAHNTSGKRGKPTQAITDSSSKTSKDTADVPDGWIWARFGEIVVNRDGERIPVSKEIRGTKAKIYDYYGASGVIDKIDSFIFSGPLLLIGEDGANLINRSTPIAFIARGQYWVNNHAHVLDGISEDLLKYLEIYINAINLEAYVTGSAQPKMNQAKLNSIPIALPPMNEQQRIAVKVAELQRLVDQLETQLEASRTTGKKLLEAMVTELTAA